MTDELYNEMNKLIGILKKQGQGRVWANDFGIFKYRLDKACKFKDDLHRFNSERHNDICGKFGCRPRPGGTCIFEGDLYLFDEKDTCESMLRNKRSNLVMGQFNDWFILVAGSDKGDLKLYTKGKKRNLLANIRSIDVKESMILFEPEMVMIKHPKAIYLINPAGGIKRIMQPGMDYTNYSLIRDRTNGLYILFDDGRPVVRMTQSFKVVGY